MKANKYLIFITLVSLIFLGFILSTAQENAVKVQPPVSDNTDVQWLWGEVLSLDPQNNALTVKYLDYETDTEKQITIVVNDETTYENAKALTDIKPLDTISVDYIIATPGKNIAKNISLEKPEAAPAEENNTTQINTTSPQGLEE